MRRIRFLFLAGQLINFFLTTIQLRCGTYRGHHPHFQERTGNQKDKTDLSRHFHLRILSMCRRSLNFAAYYDDYFVEGLSQFDRARWAEWHRPLPKLLALDAA